MTLSSQDFSLTQTANEKLSALKLTLRKGRKQRQCVKRQSGQFKELLSCNFCEHRSTKTAYTYYHELQEHIGIKQKCTECTYSHYFSTKVITHFTLVHLKFPKKSIMFTRVCDECNFKTKRQDHLKHHKESVHDGIIYSCDSCTFQTNRKGNLGRHDNENHLEIRLPCDEDQFMYNRVFQINQYSFYRRHLLEFTVSWGKEAPYQKLNLRKIN